MWTEKMLPLVFVQLFHAYKFDGDKKAAQRIISSVTYIAGGIAKKFIRNNPRFELNELMAEGVLGMYHALDLFDFDKGDSFDTYATWWARFYIQRYIKGGLVKNAKTSVVSYSQETKNNENNMIGNIAGKEKEPCDILESEEIKEKMLARLDTLPDREKDILKLRFLEGWGMKEIGEKHNCTKEWVRQLINTALKRFSL